MNSKEVIQGFLECNNNDPEASVEICFLAVIKILVKITEKMGEEEVEQSLFDDELHEFLTFVSAFGSLRVLEFAHKEQKSSS